MAEFLETIQDLRTGIAVDAARASHVFEKTLLDSATPMPPGVRETNMMAHFGSFHGFALAEVLRIIEARGDAELTAEVVAVVNDIGMNGDDGRCGDIWPAVEARLSMGGIGTAAWDEIHGA